MRIFKSLAPILVLLFFSFYGYHHYPRLPQLIINAVVFLPVLLSLMAIGLSVHFRRSHVFFYVVLIVACNVVLGMGLAETHISYALISFFVPVLLVLLSLFPDKGIVSLRALPSQLTLIISLLFVLLMAHLQPVWLSHVLLTDWLPSRYFDWTSQAQTVVYVSTIAVISMMIIYAAQPSTHAAAGLGVLIMLVLQLNFGGEDRSLHVFSSVALLMCLYALLQESWRMAYLDELTELPGRRALKDRLQKIGGGYTLAMLDVDHFKKFNDNYGHDAGDAVLRMIAGQLKKVKGGGTAYRYGGEEFTVVFNSKRSEEAIPYLEDLRESIASTPFVVNRASRRNNDKKSNKKTIKARSVQVTISVGVADSSTPGSPWDILKQADKALYKAKSKGRNRVCE